MARAPVAVDSLKQGNYVARYIGSLPREEQYSESIDIIVGGMGAIERQAISGSNSTLQIAFARTEASILISIPQEKKGDFYADIADTNEEREERVFRGRREMTAATIEHSYIVRDSRIGGGESIIAGTDIRVRTLVEYWRMGTRPEDLLQPFPHLTLAQIFDALSYYQNHQEEINKYMQSTKRLTPGELRARLHQRTPVVPDVSPADVIRELRDEQ